MAWLVKCLTFDFSLSHDLTACEFEPHVRLYGDGVEPAWDTLSPSLSSHPSIKLSLPLSK